MPAWLTPGRIAAQRSPLPTSLACPPATHRRAKSPSKIVCCSRCVLHSGGCACGGPQGIQQAVQCLHIPPSRPPHHHPAWPTAPLQVPVIGRDRLHRGGAQPQLTGAPLGFTASGPPTALPYDRMRHSCLPAAAAAACTSLCLASLPRSVAAALPSICLSPPRSTRPSPNCLPGVSPTARPRLAAPSCCLQAPRQRSWMAAAWARAAASREATSLSGHYSSQHAAAADGRCRVRPLQHWCWWFCGTGAPPRDLLAAGTPDCGAPASSMLCVPLSSAPSILLPGPSSSVMLCMLCMLTLLSPSYSP